eukprot:1607882-Alexandrium_andersonii.AAC.1
MVEDFRQEWRKNEYAQLKKTADLTFLEAWKETGKRWTQYPQEAKAYMAAAGLLSQTNGDIPKLYETREA